MMVYKLILMNVLSQGDVLTHRNGILEIIRKEKSGSGKIRKEISLSTWKGGQISPPLHIQDLNSDLFTKLSFETVPINF